ncbi:probable cytochrome P450 6a13 [Uranotaenia lowii]|uniref:probable cytochrome P450 6a13 n=1 Tax=Uranotaenia lowii TaxID=190385 RepID=UPI00247AC9FD|nr:probable cytochrome P450 6a13 [Uranotaenia lowii]
MWIEVLTLFLAPFIIFGLYVKRNYGYWARRNVAFVEPKFPGGNFGEATQMSLAELSEKHYKAMKGSGKFYGLFSFVKPMIVLTDLDLIKTVLIKDFNYFPDRGFYYNARDDPLSAHMFAIEGNYWRSLRTKLTPTFTSGKMKAMFGIVQNIADNLTKCLIDDVGEGADLEMKDYLARFTTDVIGGCALGLDCNSFEDPNNQFRYVGRKLFDTPKAPPQLAVLLKNYPDWGRALRFRSLHEDASEFFFNTVKNTLEHRQSNQVDRKDFLNLLLELRNNGVALTTEEIAAQALIIFLAGYETSSSTQTFCLYQLALNEACQEKARLSVLEAIEKHDGLTFEALQDMAFLDQCINETLRLYPPVPILERKAFQDYQIPETNIVVPRKMMVNIPIFAIQRDEQYYSNPTEFDPDRFNPEQVAQRHPMSFLPFGDGPRICIGLRFGMMQTRMGLATILSRFSLKPCSKTPIPMVFTSRTPMLQSKEGIWLKVVPLKER